MTVLSAPIQRYIDNRYSVGLAPYEQSLQKQGLDPRAQRIVDVGCGPGQWAFAASRVARDADVQGYDINLEEIGFARSFASENGFDSVQFAVAGYMDLLDHIEPGSCDVVMCNGVLMYLDRDVAFEIFSSLLRPGGQLFFFHNHHLGYYLKKTCLATAAASPRRIFAYGVKPLVLNLPRNVMLGQSKGDSLLTVRGLTRLADKHGLDLWEIPSEPILEYDRSFLGLPYVFSMAGRKR